jgi:hypothetical protein
MARRMTEDSVDKALRRFEKEQRPKWEKEDRERELRTIQREVDSIFGGRRSRKGR